MTGDPYLPGFGRCGAPVICYNLRSRELPLTGIDGCGQKLALIPYIPKPACESWYPWRRPLPLVVYVRSKATNCAQNDFCEGSGRAGKIILSEGERFAYGILFGRNIVRLAEGTLPRGRLQTS